MSNVLDLINNLPSQSAIVVRHAARFDIHGNDAHYTTGLTEKGLVDAYILGTRFPHFDSYRLFYSKAKRCRQTAERIRDGLVDAGMNVESISQEAVLSVSYMLADLDTAFDYSETFGDDFIRTWFDGHLEPGFFKPLKESLAQHLDYLRAQLQTSNGLDMHVSHDWNVMVLREGIFGLRHEDLGWPDFLSGLVFSLGPEGMTAAVRDGKNIRKMIL